MQSRCDVSIAFLFVVWKLRTTERRIQAAKVHLLRQDSLYTYNRQRRNLDLTNLKFKILRPLLFLRKYYVSQSEIEDNDGALRRIYRSSNTLVFPRIIINFSIKRRSTKLCGPMKSDATRNAAIMGMGNPSRLTIFSYLMGEEISRRIKESYLRHW